MDASQENKLTELTEQEEYELIEKLEQEDPDFKLLPEETKNMTVINRLNDALFKFIFARKEHKHILIAFLNSILDDSKQIEDLTYIDRESSPRFEGGKGCRFDVRAKAKDGRIFHVEVQKSDDVNFFERSLFYACDSYANPLKAGMGYDKLAPVIFIGLLGYEQFEGNNVHSHYMLMETRRHNIGTDALEFHFFELTKLQRDESIAGEKFLDWLKYMASIKRGGDAQMQQLAQNDEMIAEALKVEEYFKIDPETRFRYMQSELEKYLDTKREAYFTQKYEAKGALSARLENARNFLSMGLSREQVAQGTGLSVEQVNKL